MFMVPLKNDITGVVGRRVHINSDITTKKNMYNFLLFLGFGQRGRSLTLASIPVLVLFQGFA